MTEFLLLTVIEKMKRGTGGLRAKVQMLVIGTTSGICSFNT